uniref:RING-CH-type domain-containing protein n=1 Tax=Tetradesmus obliquus TaxID=3088 RepID=A0A383VB01_TETOB|eukprot:jgi/Sobl393_1/16336/SZX62123.1
MADSNTEGESCWVCLSGLEDAPEKQLELACRCPRPVHRECLARWQLQQAGRREEHYCRFCEKAYPDWKDSLTPKELKPSTPIMAVSVRGRVHKLRVRPGPDGKEDFKRQVRALLGYDDSMEFDVIFECKTPHSGEKVQLHGFSAFDAATHCAAVSAAKRLKNKAHRTSSAAAAAAAAAGSSPGSIHSSGSSGAEPMSRSSSAPPSSSSIGSAGGSSSNSPSPSAASPSHSQRQHSPSTMPNHLITEYRDVMQLASASSASISSQQQLAPGSPFPHTTVPEHLQAQYRQFVQQRHQQHVAKQRALRARAAAAAGQMRSREFSSEVAAAAQGPSTAAPALSEAAMAWAAAGLPSHPCRPSSSSGSAAADASALLTATGQAGSTAQMQQQLAGTAMSAAAAAAEMQLSCPLPSDPCTSSSSPTAVAEELWANCGALSEPLPVLPAIYRSSSAPAPTPPLEASGSAALAVPAAAPARTVSCPEGLGPSSSSSSIGCLGRWGAAVPGSPRLQQSGQRRQQRKLAEVAAGWLKQLAPRKADRLRV